MNGFHSKLAVLRCLLAPYFIGMWVLGIFSLSFGEVLWGRGFVLVFRTIVCLGGL